jgi:hypothetical protein
VLSWAPLILKSRSSWSAPVISVVGSIPSLLAAIGMGAAAIHSDRHGDRRWHLAGACWAGALGVVVSAWVHSPVLTLAAFSLVLLGLTSTMGPFWALATSQMSQAATAGAIAFISSTDALGGSVDLPPGDFSHRILARGNVTREGALQGKFFGALEKDPLVIAVAQAHIKAIRPLDKHDSLAVNGPHFCLLQEPPVVMDKLDR